ncbi:hypothetical protein [Methyloradius palustris]|uniref:hypothetical protein n=1 Tax=Methyloradius palustris TaxID=2778876 RepID=UPI001C8BF33F|nr:hypothetical protein [Methyloradius palustris]
MTSKPKNPPDSPLKKTVHHPDSRDTLPEKQIQTRVQPAYPSSKAKIRQIEEAQQQ